MISEATILNNNNLFMDAHRIECFYNVGDRVFVKWTNNNKYWFGKGRLHKINEKSIKVELLESSNCIEGKYYKPGLIITVPSTLSYRWSVNNTVCTYLEGF